MASLSNFLLSYNQINAPMQENLNFNQEDLVFADIPSNNFDRLNQYNQNQLTGLENIGDVLPQQQISQKSSQNTSLSKKLSPKKEEVKQRVAKQLRLRGVDEATRKAIQGNIYQESGYNPEIISRDGYDSYGLCQWTKDRRKKLHSMFGKQPSIEQQVDFILYELNTSEKKAKDALDHAQTVEDKTEAFMNNFERPNKRYANLRNRLKGAREA